MTLNARHRSNHSSLLRSAWFPSSQPSRRRLDAIIVPAARASLQQAITLSAALSVRLVLLCSHQAQVERVARRVQATFGASALVVEVPEGHAIAGFDQQTSDSAFRELSFGRTSNLSLKRNLGVLLARKCGWRKIMFLDDDIVGLEPRAVERLASQLDHHPIAAMVSRDFPDNSVVCHARRFAGFRQEVFVSGAVLGVDVQHPDVSFFPDVYNEDWMFFARSAADRALPHVGDVWQQDFDPFADPHRAGREEFGDIIAEGLYALFQGNPHWSYEEKLLAATSTRYWARFGEARCEMITAISDRLMNGVAAQQTRSTTVDRALESLRCAAKQHPAIKPELCGGFIQSWQDDHHRWQKLLRGIGAPMSARDALDDLGLRSWISCHDGKLTTSSSTRVAQRQSEPYLATSVR